MKGEIIACLTWYANKVAETVQYTNWSDEFCRKEIKESTATFITELRNHIDWNNLTEDICKELRFNLWMTDESIDEEIKKLKTIESDDPKLISFDGNRLTPAEKIAKLENQRNLWLIPLYLLPVIPISTKLTNISGNTVVYNGNNVDNDIRFGCIAYGIKPKKITEISGFTPFVAKSNQDGRDWTNE